MTTLARLRQLHHDATEFAPGYVVTEDGRIFSVSSNWRGYGPRELKQEINRDGYAVVRVQDPGGKRRTLRVHQIVASHFLKRGPGDGPTACPILARRTLAEFGKYGKVLWHVFLPNASDHDCHDHPRPFLTVALRGEYEDIQPDGTTDLVRAPAVRYRRAEHAHITRVGPLGCTTLCLMGPVQRAWGFWRDGHWLEWRTYERLFGLSFRCETTDALGVSPSSVSKPFLGGPDE